MRNLARAVFIICLVLYIVPVIIMANKGMIF